MAQIFPIHLYFYLCFQWFIPKHDDKGRTKVAASAKVE